MVNVSTGTPEDRPVQELVPSAPPPAKRKRKKGDFIYHINTRNISFLQTARDLKSLGVRNNMFFLKLYNERLEYIDPFDPFLPEESKIEVINECIVNPWYFLRECVRIPEQGGNGIPYQLHRANLAATYCFLLGMDHYLVIPRQKGKTQSTIAILDWAFLFGTTNSEFMFINKRQDDANSNLERLKQQRDILPSFMRMKEVLNEDGKLEKGRDNVQSLVNPTTNNKIVTKPSARSMEHADGLGRGCTQPEYTGTCMATCKVSFFNCGKLLRALTTKSIQRCVDSFE